MAQEPHFLPVFVHVLCQNTCRSPLAAIAIRGGKTIGDKSPQLNWINQGIASNAILANAFQAFLALEKSPQTPLFYPIFTRFSAGFGAALLATRCLIRLSIVDEYTRECVPAELPKPDVHEAANPSDRRRRCLG